MPPSTSEGIQVGDNVKVPGNMFGTVKYVGGVDGKPGRFVGVELASEFASKGKNNGDVAGKYYFRTAVSGAGVFVPLSIAEKVKKAVSASPSVSATPTKMGRPSMSSVKSPSISNFRNTVGPTAGRRTPTFARSVAGTPRTPFRPGDRPPSRAASEIADRRNVRSDLEDKLVQYANEKRLLEKKCRELEKQVAEQSATLGELEQTMAEFEAVEGAQTLRAQLRDKNDKIAALTAEFDAHRADFRSTLDTLEIAASETERMYEEKVRDLENANRDLQDRGDDFETVALQLKQLEEIVSELEEGLEDARRGEAEASGEAEFLRGEVERNRLELKREREKAANALKEASNAVESGGSSAPSRDLEQKEDEIRGLKAIIHSLSRGNPTPTPSTPRQQNGNREDQEQIGNLERRIQELEGLVDRKTNLHEELERENEVLRQAIQQNTSPDASRLMSSRSERPDSWNQRRSSQGSAPSSPQQARNPPSPARARQSNDRPLNLNRPLPSRPGKSTNTSTTAPQPAENNNNNRTDSSLFCDLCETPGHDILTCTNMFGAGRKVKPNTPGAPAPLAPSTSQRANANHTPSPPRAPAAASTQATASAPIPGFGPAPGKMSGVVDESKWCALCERDGHDSIDCPFDD